jgi:ParB/RepB/Spo0J family partition protein
MSTKRDQIFNAAGSVRVDWLQTTEPTAATPQMLPIPVSLIDRDEGNPRETFDDESLDRLAAVMKRQGQIQNCVVYRDPATNRFRLTCGERRWRAAKRAGIENLFCLVLPRATATAMREEMALAENTAREDLRPVELARSYRRMMDKHKWSGAELARNIGVAQSSVSEHLALLELDADTQRKVDAGELSKRAVVREMPPKTARRRHRPARRGQRGVLELTTCTIRVRRGQTLEAAAAELATHLAGEKRDAA